MPVWLSSGRSVVCSCVPPWRVTVMCRNSRTDASRTRWVLSKRVIGLASRAYCGSALKSKHSRKTGVPCDEARLVLISEVDFNECSGALACQRAGRPYFSL